MQQMVLAHSLLKWAAVKAIKALLRYFTLSVGHMQLRQAGASGCSRLLTAETALEIRGRFDDSDLA